MAARPYPGANPDLFSSFPRFVVVRGCGFGFKASILRWVGLGASSSGSLGYEQRGRLSDCYT